MPPMSAVSFEPDYTQLVLAAQNKTPARLPLYEHSVAGNVMEALSGVNPYAQMRDEDEAEGLEGFRRYWAFFRSHGYDVCPYEVCLGDALPGSGALGAHREGCIKTRADFERYPWDAVPDLYFEKADRLFTRLAATRPPGMKAVGGIGNGPFEAVQDITGYFDLCYIRADDPALYADLFRKMGEVICAIWARFLQEPYADAFCVMRQGDDLGYKQQTLLSPADIRTHILPTYRAVVARVHDAGYPYLLHSCGNIFSVMDDFIDTARIDAKHSNEDAIAPFSDWVDRYGARIGNFGGLDTDVVCRETPEAIRDAVYDCLNRVHGGGGIAFSTGNSIPSYVPPERYAAMLDAVRAWRGEHRR